MFLRCYFTFVLPILEFCSLMWGSAATFSFLSARCIRWPGFIHQSFLSLCHRRHVARLCMLYNVYSNFNHCLFSELPHASTRVRDNPAAAAAHPLEFEVSRCRTSQFARSLVPAQVRMWNDLLYIEFDTGTLDGFRGAVNRWLLPLVVFSFSVAQVLVGFRNKFINNFLFPTWACAAGFNKINKNNNNN